MIAMIDHQSVKIRQLVMAVINTLSYRGFTSKECVIRPCKPAEKWLISEYLSVSLIAGHLVWEAHARSDTLVRYFAYLESRFTLGAPIFFFLRRLPSDPLWLLEILDT